ncbi:MAG: nucleotidyltransferase domain-containing protein [Chlamydiae bacterium]|nr:nucleotidyltransferase domain-containing protein [Chlamydiota bacterium]MBI3277828.1 nucleotidyltransferase domain-containing protein [Chlamydiota bacterium]
MRKKKLSQLISNVAQQIVKSVHPDKIILFGSYAYGKPNQDSDVDLLVIMKTRKRPVKRAPEITKAIQFYPFPMDILVRTPQEINHRLQLKDPFYLSIIHKGKVLYG